MLQIDTNSFTYFDKKDIILRYAEFASVSIASAEEIDQPAKSSDFWNKLKEVLRMPTITDWLMVIITFIYVVATILICRANIRSAKATRDQLEESKSQYEENKRLECMPFLQLEIPINQENPLFEIELPMYQDEIEDTLYKTVCLKNLGNGTATNITFTWRYQPLMVGEAGYPPINAIMRGDQYCFQLTFDLGNIDKDTQGVLEFQYDDLLGNTYTQKVILCFEEFDLVRCENDTPNYCGVIRYSVKEKKENT